MADDCSSSTGTQAIQRALMILNCFSFDVESLSISDITKLVGLPYSTASRIVGILEREGYLLRDRNTKRFSIGRRIYSLGYCVRENDYLRKVIYPYLVRLRDEFGETALIYTREGFRRVCFEKVPALHSFKFSPNVGSEYVLWAGAGGRGFLAFASAEDRAKIINDIQPLTPSTKMDAERIMKDLFHLCKYGWCYCINEYQEGFSSISGVVVDAHSELLCTISVTGPSSRFTEETVESLKQRIPEFCMEISSLFGWKRDDESEFIFRSPSLDDIIANL